MKELDDLAEEHRGLLRRLQDRTISPTEYAERVRDIGEEYIRLLDSLQPAKPLNQLEVPAR